MKKRFLLISLVLVLAITVIAPSNTLAKSGKTWSGEFTATADVIVVDPGISIPIASTPTTLTLWTTGEMIEGEFTSADGWPTLKRGSLSVTHESTITLDYLTGAFLGTANADIVISFPCNGGELSGNYSAELTGSFIIVGELIIILDVLDEGTFAVSGRDGGKSIEANGDWIANLIFTEETLAGTANIYGVVRAAPFGSYDMGTGTDAYTNNWPSNLALEIGRSASGTGYIDIADDSYDQYRVPVYTGEEVTFAFTPPPGSKGIDLHTYDTDGSALPIINNVQSTTTHAVISTGNGYIYLVVDADRLIDMGEYELTVSVGGLAPMPPVADPNGPYSGEVGSPISFDGSGSCDPDGTIVSYDWDFGDGGTGTGVSPSYTYTASGLYTVTLTVTDNDGATDTETTTVDISLTAYDMGTGTDAYTNNWPSSMAMELSRSASGTGHIDVSGDPYDQYRIPVSAGEQVTLVFTPPAGSKGIDLHTYDTDGGALSVLNNVRSTTTHTVTSTGNGYICLVVDADRLIDVGEYHLSVSVSG